MNIYKILKIFTKFKSRRLKLFGLWVMHIMHRRYIGVFLDPVLGCNLRCRMCYMSDPSKEKRELGGEGRLTDETLNYIASTFFPYALKLQIGCATEPTLYKGLVKIIEKARQKGVPYISMTTNGQLLSEETLRKLVDAGLNEVTLSVHGLQKDVYENMMKGAKFERFQNLIQILKRTKKDYPGFKIRINYVMNHDNVNSLRSLYAVLDGLKVDVLQLRPIQKLGESDYKDFSLDTIRASYDEVLVPIINQCKADGTVCLCPTKENLDSLEESFDPLVDYLEELTYYYMTEKGCNKPQLEWKRDTFKEYHNKKGTEKDIRNSILHWKKKADTLHSTRKLNYSVN
ncbi:MAG: radical SAM protein [Muribaculaceae bacterium]|nr:radical SAM protein [Muribaculaceae bacterium]